MRVKTIAAAGAKPIGVGNARVAARLARTAPRTVVLQATINVIRFPHIGSHSIKLTRDNRIDELPGVTLIVSDIQAAIVSNQKVFAVLRIDPAGVMVAVRNAGL